MKNKNNQPKTWHQRHAESMPFRQRLADKLANTMGSWKFIIIQTFVVACWMIFNIIAYISHWDPYPFILLNLLFSTQAAYSAPIIMMSQNRQNDRDRLQALEDFRTNVEAKKEIEAVQRKLASMETKKLDKIISLLTNK